MSRITLHCSITGCCLHDPDAKEFYCIAETYSGERCGNPTYKQTPYCRLHHRRCLDLYLEYKGVCSKLRREYKTMSKKELEDNIANGNECLRLRVNHFDQCFRRSEDDRIDFTHQQAINYTAEVVRESKAELYRRRYPKR